MLGKKCLIKKCPNHSDAGSGKMIRIYDDNGGYESQEFICGPCWETITGENPNKHSVLRIIESSLK